MVELGGWVDIHVGLFIPLDREVRGWPQKGGDVELGRRQICSDIVKRCT